MAKTMPDWFVKNYPVVKVIAWRMFRAFMGAFIPVMGAFLAASTPENFQSWENAKIFILPVLIASFAAGVAGLGKYLRELYPNSEIINKLPI